MRALMACIGAASARREVMDILERRPPDRRLDQLLHVRKQRLNRLERERNDARLAWRARRRELGGCKVRWRHARDDAQRQWLAARAAFSAMTITSGDFKKAKAAYERMKKAADELQLEWREIRHRCRVSQSEYFAARLVVLQSHRQQEKLGFLRDELRAQEAARYMEA